MLTFKAQTLQNAETHSNNSSANFSRRIVWVSLTILVGWCLRDYVFSSQPHRKLWKSANSPFARKGAHCLGISESPWACNITKIIWIFKCISRSVKIKIDESRRIEEIFLKIGFTWLLLNIKSQIYLTMFGNTRALWNLKTFKRKAWFFETKSLDAEWLLSLGRDQAYIIVKKL